MNRVTKTIRTKSNERRVVYNCDMCEYYGTPKCDVHACHVRALERLAEYEDTGRTPEEVANLYTLFLAMKGKRDELNRALGDALTDMRAAGRSEEGICIACAHRDEATDLCTRSDYMCSDCPQACVCKNCRDGSNWEWRGAKS